MLRFREQAERFGAEFLTEKATKVDLSERPFKVCVRDDVYEAEAVIVSTGAQSLMLGLEAEQRLLGHGLSTCATCDGFFFRGQHIAVVGGGDSAIEEAIVPHQVRRQGHRDPPPRRAAGLEDHAGPGVRQPEDRVPVEHAWSTTSSASERLEGAVVRNVNTGETTRRCRSPGCSSPSATARTPTCSPACSTSTRTATSSPADGSTATNVDGVFACGDVQDHTYRQAVTAAGSGCMAAIDAERWLEAQHASTR